MKIRHRNAKTGASLMIVAMSVVLVAGSAYGASTSATAKIKADWEAFFLGSTSANRKIALVQDGSSFAKVIKSQSTSPLAKSVTANVSKVMVDSKDTATVRYSLNLGGKPALTNQKGEAVLQGGTWKVGAQSFCSLLALEQVKLPVCSSSS
jgi:hypothetical protein